MTNPGERTLSQELHTRVLSEQMETLSIQQIREYAIEATRQITVKDKTRAQSTFSLA